ncbi:hypothetical protein LCGC14_0439160 [marine sediment metagenome]|uniref:Uncharacterized protein n=1 Tax=marine sediment metagenome TaxID=412755 RepID=A0A0F9VV27_9ZZZZ
MKINLTDKEIEHIYFLCKSDIEDGRRAIESVPKATELHKLWLECFELDRNIIKKTKFEAENEN